MTRSLLRQPATVVWFGLVLIALVSWWLGTDQGAGSHKLAAILLLALAFTKVRFVGMYFMELRGAPLVLKLLFQGWCLVVCCALVGMYLSGG
jgi:Prokaryotic Cytochrome C oxidase subunit IV